jgi:hypothetical protein
MTAARPSTPAPIRALPVQRFEPAPIAPGARPPRPLPGIVQDTLAIELASDESLFGPQPTRRGDLPDPDQWAGHIAQAVVEVMTGSRPAPQVIRWLTPEVYAVVARRGALAARRAQGPHRRPARRATVRRVRVCEPADGVAEAAVVVIDGPRVRALAMRLVGQDGRWRVDALQVG